MTVAIAADHVGMVFKDGIASMLRARGDAVADFGTHDLAPVDYPNYAYAVALAVACGRAERGIIVCAGSGGACIAANKLDGVRCAAPTELLSAESSRRHYDANVLALDASVSGWETVERLALTFMLTPFDRGMHVGRVVQISRFDDVRRTAIERVIEAR